MEKELSHLYLIKRKRDGIQFHAKSALSHSKSSTILCNGDRGESWKNSGSFYVFPPIVFTSRKEAEEKIAELKHKFPKGYEFLLKFETRRWWL
jgi:hypothetical protein